MARVWNPAYSLHALTLNLRNYRAGDQGRALIPYRLVYAGIFGRDDRIRTCDPHTPSVMRYQAALRPDRRRGFTLQFLAMQGREGA